MEPGEISVVNNHLNEKNIKSYSYFNMIFNFMTNQVQEFYSFVLKKLSIIL